MPFSGPGTENMTKKNLRNDRHREAPDDQDILATRLAKLNLRKTTTNLTYLRKTGTVHSSLGDPRTTRSQHRKFALRASDTRANGRRKLRPNEKREAGPAS